MVRCGCACPAHELLGDGQAWEADRCEYAQSMGKQFAGITDKLRAFIEAQHIFFVATAARDGSEMVPDA